MVKITIVDVARLAGVSSSTASRVLSGHPATSPDSRERVLAAAETLGFRVNRLARGLRSGTSGEIGVLVTNLVNASFHSIVEEIQPLSYQAGYRLSLGISSDSKVQEAQFLEGLADHGADGLIIVPTGRNVDAISQLFDQGLGVVALIRRFPKLNVPTVLTDDRHGAHEATKHLLGLGHRRVGFIGGPATLTTGRERFRGYLDAHRDEGIEPVGELVQRGALTASFGRQAVTRVMESRTPCTAILVANHESIFGVLPELVRRRVRIPEQLSLICFEDVPLFESWHPPITVVDNHPAELARVSMAALSRQLERGHRGPDRGDDQIHYVPTTLKVRESTAPPSG